MNKTLKEDLRNGMTKEELLSLFEMEIEDAEKEIKAEDAKAKANEQNKKKIEEVRECLVNMAGEYLEILGLIDNNSKDIVTEVCKHMKSLEDVILGGDEINKDINSSFSSFLDLLL